MLRKLLSFFCLGLADVADAVEQDEIADSLMTEPAEEETPVEEQAEEVTEEPTLETIEEVTEEEDDANWLPGEQERVFPDAAIERYAQGRYPALLRIWQDPKRPEDERQQARQILHDKLNSDILIQQGQEEPEEEEVEETLAPTQAEAKLPTREEYFNSLRTAVKSRTDPQVAKDFFTQFNKVFGLTDAQIASTLKANPNAATEFTELLSVYALNMVNTFADQLIWGNLQKQLETVFPGFEGMHARSANIMAWDTVRNSNEAYAKLPQFGTKEFSTKARAAATRYFGSDTDFENAQFTKVANGQRVPLPPLENAQKKYALLAKVMAGQQVDPKLIRQAVKTGANKQRRIQQTRSAGRLRTGTTRAQGTSGGGDDLFTEGLALYRQEHGQL